MPRYALRLAFDGRHYAGTAPQPDQHTMVSHLHKAGAALQGGAPVANVRTCGRLDAGVSASQLVAHVDMNNDWVLTDLAKALTSHLQPMASVLAIAAVADDWDALFHCTRKRPEKRDRLAQQSPRGDRRSESEIR